MSNHDVIKWTMSLAHDVSESSWTKLLTIGISGGLTWEAITSAIAGLEMNAGLAAFWAIIFTGIAKMISLAIKNYLVIKFPKLFKEVKKDNENKE